MRLILAREVPGRCRWSVRRGENDRRTRLAVADAARGRQDQPVVRASPSRKLPWALASHPLAPCAAPCTCTCTRTFTCTLPHPILSCRSSASDPAVAALCPSRRLPHLPVPPEAAASLLDIPRRGTGGAGRAARSIHGLTQLLVSPATPSHTARPLSLPPNLGTNHHLQQTIPPGPGLKLVDSNKQSQSPEFRRLVSPAISRHLPFSSFRPPRPPLAVAVALLASCRATIVPAGLPPCT